LRLVFQQKYLSIDQFDPVEIPNFVVLTGMNGAGKSHLLTALEKRFVILEGLQNPHIVLFNYETFKLDNEQAFSAQQLSAERDSAWQFHQGAVAPQGQGWRNATGEQYDQWKKDCEVENKSLWDLAKEKTGQYTNVVKNFFTQPGYKENPQAQALYSLAKKLPYGVDEINRDEFDKLFRPFVFKGDFLPHQLGKVFWDYYVRFSQNQVYEYQSQKHGKEYPFLSEGDFFKAHGRPPWELVNEVLVSFDSLKYRVTSPEGSNIFGNYQLRLQHIDQPDLKVEFSQLSSGERILMALVASVYKSSSDKHFPDVLLLDEVDASLHPSMMKNMLDVIQRVFLAQGVKVILITHSPTTLALAPEDSVYVMNRTGSNRIEKKSNSAALSILTQGFATLEEGLTLFNEIALTGLTLITEGHNTFIIERALQLFKISGVKILTGVEGVSGKNQLKTLFHFFSKIDHSNKVLFVWDCDASKDLQAENRTYPFVLPQRGDNLIATKGIENAFPEKLFEGFKKTITTSANITKVEFDESRKKDFCERVIALDDSTDFSHFSSLILEIQRILALEG
jgi:energy-coupling factor transporter ATP-binding protein EcfA2